MSEAKPKRKNWQFHLSTAVSVLVASAIVLGANVTTISRWTNGRQLLMHLRGWPCPYDIAPIEYTADWHRDAGRSITSNLVSETDYEEYFNSRKDIKQNSTRNLIANIASALLIIVIIGFASEWLIRRREARKT